MFEASTVRSLASLGMTVLCKRLSISFSTRSANRINYQIILVRKDGAHIESEATIDDIADDRWRCAAQTSGEFYRRTMPRDNFNCNRCHRRFWQCATADLGCAPANGDLQRQITQSVLYRRGSIAQLVFGTLRPPHRPNLF